MSLHAIPGGKKKDADEPTECPFCHPDFPCYGRGHDAINCFRAEELAFFGQSEVHYDKDDKPIWTIAAVRFKRPLEFEVIELPSDEDATGDADAEAT